MWGHGLRHQASEKGTVVAQEGDLVWLHVVPWMWQLWLEWKHVPEGRPQDRQDRVDTADSGARRLHVSAQSHLVAVGITVKTGKARLAAA